MVLHLIRARYLWRPQRLTRASSPSYEGPVMVLCLRRLSPRAGEVCVSHCILWIMTLVGSGARSVEGGGSCQCT
jgi:hypothetical protein